jgi:ABC-type sugar transport system ATPase subunit
LRVKEVSKRYGDVCALDNLSLDLQAGAILALVGQNGAGKSTAGKVIAGLVPPDDGSVAVQGRPLDDIPQRDRPAAVAIVQQELSIVPTISVAANVFLGARRGGSWRTSTLAKAASPYLERLGLSHLDPAMTAAELSVAEQQLVEIARILARDSRVIVFDEPTASLSDYEIARVETVVRDLAADGRGVIYVTHRLAEVMRFCHQALVLRDGKAVARVSTESTPLAQIVGHMLGRPLGALYPPRASGVGQTVLEARDASAEGISGALNVELHAGEITGLASQLGGGASGALRILAGYDRLSSGSLYLQGRPVRLRSPGQAVQAGILRCSDDRKRDGLYLSRTVTENLTALSLGTVSRGPWLVKRLERRMATAAAEYLGVDRSRLRAPASALSGGNQQKVALGKLACRSPEPKVLLLDEPTRGVDVGARVEIYRLIRRLADSGMAVAFASSDVSEIIGLADRIVTFYRSRQVRTVNAADVDDRDVLLDVTHPAVGAEGHG